MRIIESGFTILPTPHTQSEILKHIERCGRVCYKSEDMITEDSAQQFIANIIKRGHEAVLEAFCAIDCSEALLHRVSTGIFRRYGIFKRLLGATVIFGSQRTAGVF